MLMEAKPKSPTKPTSQAANSKAETATASLAKRLKDYESAKVTIADTVSGFFDNSSGAEVIDTINVLFHSWLVETKPDLSKDENQIHLLCFLELTKFISQMQEDILAVNLYFNELTSINGEVSHE